MRQAERLTQMMIDNWLGGYYEPEEESGYVANMLQKEGSRILDIGESRSFRAPLFSENTH